MSELLPQQLRGLRVLIVHDWLTTWAGSERCVQQILHMFPDADLVVGVIAPSMRDFNSVARRARETWLGRVPLARRHHRWFLLLEGLAFASLNTERYDLVISSSHALDKLVRPRRGALHVCYCHSPPRYLWDLSAVYREQSGWLEGLALGVFGPPLRWLDRKAAQQVGTFVANSYTTRERIQRAYGRSAEVVHPPVEAKPINQTASARSDFLLYLGRLVPYKRVDLAVAAASKLGVRLIVAGEGPERLKLERLAGPSVEFRGEVSEAEAGELYSTCAAFVFCGEEDFGIAPLEANAHGAPAIAYRAGGVAETMVDGVTAEFFGDQTVKSVTEAIERGLAKCWDRQALVENATRYSPAAFRGKLAGIIASAVT